MPDAVGASSPCVRQAHLSGLLMKSPPTRGGHPPARGPRRGSSRWIANPAEVSSGGQRTSATMPPWKGGPTAEEIAAKTVMRAGGI